MSKIPVFILSATLVVLACMVLAVRFAVAGPTNEVVAQQFSQNLATYIRLRDMLISDRDVRQIASWGVRTSKSPMGKMPPVDEMTLERYQTYLSLLSAIGAIGMSRSEGVDPEICILGWASGFAGSAVHVGVCRSGKDAQPSRSSKVGSETRFKIDDEWYIKRDDR